LERYLQGDEGEIAALVARLRVRSGRDKTDEDQQA